MATTQEIRKSGARRHRMKGKPIAKKAPSKPSDNDRDDRKRVRRPDRDAAQDKSEAAARAKRSAARQAADKKEDAAEKKTPSKATAPTSKAPRYSTKPTPKPTPKPSVRDGVRDAISDFRSGNRKEGMQDVTEMLKQRELSSRPAKKITEGAKTPPNKFAARRPAPGSNSGAFGEKNLSPILRRLASQKPNEVKILQGVKPKPTTAAKTVRRGDTEAQEAWDQKYTMHGSSDNAGKGVRGMGMGLPIGPNTPPRPK